jgi:hypothetical protein
MNSLPLVQFSAWRGQVPDKPATVWINPMAVTFIEPTTRLEDIVGTRIHFGHESSIDVRELPTMVAGRLAGHLADPGPEYRSALDARLP